MRAWQMRCLEWMRPARVRLWLGCALLALLCVGGPAHTVRADAITEVERAIARGRYPEALATLAPLVKRQRPRALALQGRIHALRGERAPMERSFRALIALFNRGAIDERDGEALWAVAEATRALGAYRDANQTFASAVVAAPERVEIELAWADLFLEKHALDEAAESVARVLERRPDHPGALALMARIELEQGRDFAAVEGRLARALALDRELTAAHVTRAGLSLRDEELAQADRHLDAALATNPRDLEALSVRAAVRFVADDRAGFARAIERVLAENPRFSRVYSIVATYAEWEHRYAELVVLSDAALRIDPDDAHAHATRGINLLRTGRESEGLEALRAAWSRDRYNEEVYNLLELYERVIAKEYESFSAPSFALRMPKRERALLAPYALPLLARAHRELTERYRFSPSEPTHVELYAAPEHFSIRATGLPQLGVQGICFGNVLIALSPKGGEFNWGQILWHELSHVFHVQLSKGRVPRWFTEGLAEFETARARPEWKREDDRPLYDALERGALPSLRELNRAFTHARKPEELMVAYYASSQAVGYIAQRFGDEAIARMLAAWGEGASTDDVVASVLGVDLSELDRGFRSALSARFGARYRGDLRIDLAQYQELAPWRKRSAAGEASRDDHAGLALALAEAGEYDAASGRAQALLQEQPSHALARFTLAHVALKRGDLRGADRELDALLEHGHDGYQIRMLRARMALSAGDPRAALPELDAAIARDAERIEAHMLMADVAAQLADVARLEQALSQWAALDQHARTPVLRLLPLLERRGAYAELVRVAIDGLYRDVHAPALHDALARGLLHQGRLHEAREEAERALALSAGETRTRAVALVREIELSLRGARKAGAKPARIGAKPSEPR